MKHEVLLYSFFYLNNTDAKFELKNEKENFEL